MVTNLRALWAQITGSLWFVPGIIVLGAMLLAAGMVELSAAVNQEMLARWPRVFGAGAESSRSMLSAIAGSMITVAGVTFSITMVAVTQASSQYTPRILRNFMRDRANQVVLGIFVGIFAYCLVVLRTIRGEDDGFFVPSLAVLLGVLLAIVGIAVLIFFVHHIATTLQASEIISRITRETVRVAEQIFPEEAREEPPDPEPGRALAAVAPDQWRPVPAPATGYIQAVDTKAGLRLLRRCGLVLRVERTVGEFVVVGLPVAWYAPHPGPVSGRREGNGEERPDIPGSLASLHAVSPYRTIDQDTGFGIRQLVDIALKALSPGINDSTTAVTCLDYLGAILVCLAARRIEPSCRGEDGVVRIVAPRPTFQSLLREACDEIRQHAGANVSVLGRALEMLETVGRATPTAGRRRAVMEQIELVHQAAGTAVPSAHDRDRLDAMAARARAGVGAAGSAR
ncbi:MAG TPA: DUF2254 domain-containing protein [Gemmatimonadales bacterium]|nr:DUF2254 domain-containing protein [Gemmatimonadales bacterium]